MGWLTAMGEVKGLWLAVRLRGTSRIPPGVERTFEVLRLKRRFNAVLLKMDESVKGTLRKVKDWVTWGEVNVETLAGLLRERGEVKGGKRLDESFIKTAFNKEGFEDLSHAMLTGEVTLAKLRKNGVDTVFRLHPPRKGFKGSVKRPFNVGGELGYRGEAINDLLKRML